MVLGYIHSERLYIIYLKDLGLETGFRSDRHLDLGDSFRVRVRDVHPRRNYLALAFADN
jgi:hypothetical protein